jgi:hypothetical protein
MGHRAGDVLLLVLSSRAGVAPVQVHVATGAAKGTRVELIDVIEIESLLGNFVHWHAHEVGSDAPQHSQVGHNHNAPPLSLQFCVGKNHIRMIISRRLLNFDTQNTHKAESHLTDDDGPQALHDVHVGLATHAGVPVVHLVGLALRVFLRVTFLQ